VRIASRPPERTSSAAAAFAFAASEDAALACSLDGGPFAPCASCSSFDRLKPGRHTLRVRGTDRAGNLGDVRSASWTVVFATAFDWAPAAPAPGQVVVFTNRSVGAVAHDWDLDGDGRCGDGRAATARRAFAAEARYRVRLRGRHASGATDTVTRQVVVSRQAPAPGAGAGGRPKASLTVAPASPLAGER